MPLGEKKGKGGKGGKGKGKGAKQDKYHWEKPKVPPVYKGGWRRITYNNPAPSQEATNAHGSQGWESQGKRAWREAEQGWPTRRRDWEGEDEEGVEQGWKKPRWNRDEEQQWAQQEEGPEEEAPEEWRRPREQEEEDEDDRLSVWTDRTEPRDRMEVDTPKAPAFSFLAAANHPSPPSPFQSLSPTQSPAAWPQAPIHTQAPTMEPVQTVTPSPIPMHLPPVLPPYQQGHTPFTMAPNPFSLAPANIQPMPPPLPPALQASLMPPMVSPESPVSMIPEVQTPTAPTTQGAPLPERPNSQTAPSPEAPGVDPAWGEYLTMADQQREREEEEEAKRQAEIYRAVMKKNQEAQKATAREWFQSRGRIEAAQREVSYKIIRLQNALSRLRSHYNKAGRTPEELLESVTRLLEELEVFRFRAPNPLQGKVKPREPQTGMGTMTLKEWSAEKVRRKAREGVRARQKRGTAERKQSRLRAQRLLPILPLPPFETIAES